jgi:uncharacterized membrane protein HdeD (DUF308 family)
VQGVAAIIIGILLVLAPGLSSVVLVQFLAILWLVSGVADLVSLIWDRRQWGWKVLTGVIGIVAGMAIIEHPLWSTILVGTALVVYLGFTGILIGVVAILRAFSGGGWASALLGIANVLIGALLLFNPFGAAIGLPLLIGMLALASGIATIATAWRMD